MKNRLFALAFTLLTTSALAQPALKMKMVNSMRFRARFIRVALSVFEEIDHVIDIGPVSHVAAVAAIRVYLRAGPEDVF